MVLNDVYYAESYKINIFYRNGYAREAMLFYVEMLVLPEKGKGRYTILLKSTWVHCPVCHNKTKTKIYKDSVVLCFPLYCPHCKKEMRVNIIRGKIYPCTRAFRI